MLLEGQLKFDECQTQPILPPPPIVRAVKQNGEISIVVQHFGAYKTLPSEVSFEILDRRDCSVAPVSYFKGDKIPLAFKTEYPNGKSCGSNVVGKVDLDK